VDRLQYIRGTVAQRTAIWLENLAQSALQRDGMRGIRTWRPPRTFDRIDCARVPTRGRRDPQAPPQYPHHRWMPPRSPTGRFIAHESKVWPTLLLSIGMNSALPKTC